MASRMWCGCPTAKRTGYPAACTYDNLEGFAINIERILAMTGPVFVALKVVPEIQNAPIGGRKPWMTRSRAQVIEDLQKELGLRI